MTGEAYFYILAGNQPTDGKVPLYVGSTRDLARRVWEHRPGWEVGILRAIESRGSFTTSRTSRWKRQECVSIGEAVAQGVEGYG